MDGQQGSADGRPPASPEAGWLRYIGLLAFLILAAELYIAYVLTVIATKLAGFGLPGGGG